MRREKQGKKQKKEWKKNNIEVEVKGVEEREVKGVGKEWEEVEEGEIEGKRGVCERRISKRRKRKRSKRRSRNRRRSSKRRRKSERRSEKRCDKYK